MKKLLLLSHLAAIFCFTTMTTTARAESSGGLFVEPGITYESTDTDINWPAPFTNSTGSVKGYGLMARLGFHINEAFFIALDGRYAKPTFSDSSTNADVSADHSTYGPVVGVQMPNFGLRVWGAYVLGGELNPGEASGGTDYKFEKANGYRVGAGFHLSFVSLNLEYQEIKYDTTLQSQGGFPLNSQFDNSDLTSKGYVISLSFPAEL